MASPLGTAQLPAPTNATEWAAALLLGLGIDPTTHTNSLQDLAAQINLEQGSNNVSGFNPLNSTEPVGSSVGGGSQGNIQSYTSWVDGLSGNSAVLLQSNNTALYNALESNATISQYAVALGNSDWEGGGDGAPQNVAYGAGVASRYNSMAKGGEGGFAALSAAYNAFFQNGITFTVPNEPSSGPGIAQIPQAAAGIASTIAPKSWTDELGTLLGDLTSSTWWERVGLFAAGGVLVLVGIFVFISTTKTGQKVESDAAVAAVA